MSEDCFISYSVSHTDLEGCANMCSGELENTKEEIYKVKRFYKQIRVEMYL